MSMIPFANSTVTLYHKQDGAITRHILTNCSLRRTTSRILDNGAVRFAESSTCRIPSNQQRPSAGDVIVPGVASDLPQSQIELARLLDGRRRDGAFLVENVSDNAGFGVLPHWAARGA